MGQTARTRTPPCCAKSFKSVYVGADSLAELMADHPGTTYRWTPTSMRRIADHPGFTVLPTVIMLVVFIYFMRRMGSQNGQAMSFGKTKALTAEGERPKVKFSDVAGIDEAVEELQEVRDFLSEPERYRKMGAADPHGVLLRWAPPAKRPRACHPRWPDGRGRHERGGPFFGIAAALTLARCSKAWETAKCIDLEIKRIMRKAHDRPPASSARGDQMRPWPRSSLSARPWRAGRPRRQRDQYAQPRRRAVEMDPARLTRTSSPSSRIAADATVRERCYPGGPGPAPRARARGSLTVWWHLGGPQHSTYLSDSDSGNI